MQTQQITHCPIHPNIELRPYPEKYGPHKGELIGWCPECDATFPVGLSYTDLLKRFIHLKRSHDELGSLLQGRDMVLNTVQQVFLDITIHARAELNALWEQIKQKGFFAWTLLQIISFHKAQEDAVDSIMRALWAQDLEDYFPKLQETS